MKPSATLSLFAMMIVAVFSASCSYASAQEAKRPNIILIFTDDQGFQDLGCFGSPNIKTPQLDQMAAEGARLTSFYAQPVCGVSRAALMTGSYPIRVAEPGNLKRLHTVPHPQETTMAEVLKKAGYATGMIGKWHLAIDRKDLPTGVGPATMPNAQGFDYFYGTPKYNGFTAYVNEHKFRSSILRNQEVVVETVESWDNITIDYTNEAIKWIKEQKRDKPFFLYLAHSMPHIPLGASENFKGKSAGGFYGDTIEEIDWSCGEIFKTLKELGIDDTTLVIFTSDNGPWVETTRGMKPDGKVFIPRDHSGNADPYRGWKMSAWDGGSRVPFIARWPGKIPAGWESDELLSTMDLLPTFASIAEADLPDVKLDGKDATDFLTRQTEASPRDDYFYYSGCLLTGVRSGSWKLVLPRADNPPGLGWWGRMIEEVPETQLFNLEQDPGETENLAAKKPDVVASLMKRIAMARNELGDIDQTGSEARFFEKGPRKLQNPISAKRNVPKKKAPPKTTSADHYDVYLLAGQSNMDGRGATSELSEDARKPFENATIFYRNMQASSDGWQLLAPGFSIPPKHKDGLPSPKFGPELGFATAMLEAKPDRKLALIKGSKGGSSLRVDWNPGVRGAPETQGPRYRDFLETIRLATTQLKQRGDRYTIRGLLWHQGESDSKSSAKVYQQRLEKFITRIREDLDVLDLPVVVGQVYDNGKRDNVRAAIRAVGTSGPGIGLVSCEDLTTWDDGTHFDAASQLELGKRYAQATLALLEKRESGQNRLSPPNKVEAPIESEKDKSANPKSKQAVPRAF